MVAATAVGFEGAEHVGGKWNAATVVVVVVDIVACSLPRAPSAGRSFQVRVIHGVGVIHDDMSSSF